jgi:hypothetical protein
MVQSSQQRNAQFCFFFCVVYAIFRGRIMERSKYANYRYSSYLQDGVAVLKIGSNLGSKPTNDEPINSNKNNNALHAVRFDSRTNLPNASKTQERLNFQNKSLYNDKAIRTTKNFIGKAWYNVGYSPHF